MLDNEKHQLTSFFYLCDAKSDQQGDVGTGPFPLGERLQPNAEVSLRLRSLDGALSQGRCREEDDFDRDSDLLVDIILL